MQCSAVPRTVDPDDPLQIVSAAGATAERLGAEARMQRSLNTSALLAGVDSGRTHLGPDTVVVMDEAGMADTNRLAALVRATAERQSKLVLVGDQAQLSSIAAGGMFTELQHHVPTAELSEVHRAQHEWERDAWDSYARAEPTRRSPPTRHTIGCTSPRPASRPPSGWSPIGIPPARSILSNAP